MLSFEYSLFPITVDTVLAVKTAPEPEPAPEPDQTMRRTLAAL